MKSDSKLLLWLYPELTAVPPQERLELQSWAKGQWGWREWRFWLSISLYWIACVPALSAKWLIVPWFRHPHVPQFVLENQRLVLALVMLPLLVVGVLLALAYDRHLVRQTLRDLMYSPPDDEQEPAEQL